MMSSYSLALNRNGGISFRRERNKKPRPASTSSYVQDTTIDEAHNTQRIVVRRVRPKMGALTLGQDCVNSVTTQIRTTLERVAEAGIELVSTGSL